MGFYHHDAAFRVYRVPAEVMRRMGRGSGRGSMMPA
jgi:hypothetical protein